MRSDLYHADEVFFTGTAAEITPIRSIDEHEVGAGPITKRIQKEFFAITSGRSELSARVPRLPRRDARQGVNVQAARQVPLSRPDVGPREEEYVLAALRSGISRSRPVRAPLRGRVRGLLRHATMPSRSPSGTAGLHLLVRAAGIGPGDEVITAPISFVASANVDALRARDAGLRRRRSRHVRARSGGGRGGRHAAHPRASCRCTCSAIPATWRPSARSPKHSLTIIEDACESVGSARSGRRVGAHGNPAVFAFYPNKQMTTRRGGHDHDRRCRARRAAPLARQPGPVRLGRLARARQARLQLPHGRAVGGRRLRPDRAPRRDPRRARGGGRALQRRCWRGDRAGRPSDADRSRRRALVVRVRRAARRVRPIATP